MLMPYEFNNICIQFNNLEKEISQTNDEYIKKILPHKYKNKSINTENLKNNSELIDTIFDQFPSADGIIKITDSVFSIRHNYHLLPKKYKQWRKLFKSNQINFDRINYLTLTNAKNKSEFLFFDRNNYYTISGRRREGIEEGFCSLCKKYGPLDNFSYKISRKKIKHIKVCNNYITCNYNITSLNSSYKDLLKYSKLIS